MKKNLNLIIVSSFALFSMFFGAGNLIFPPTLGLWAGNQFVPSIIGFLITAVGIVMLAVISTTKVGGNIEDNATPVGKTFSYIYGIAILISIGPGLAIPRTAATTYEIIELAFIDGFNPIISSIIFFGLVLLFSLNETSVIDNLGKILTPTLLVMMAIIIIKGFASPIGVPVQTEAESVFGKSFLEGYQTMDCIAAMAFTIIVIDGYKNKNITDTKSLVRLTIITGIIAGIGLSIVYGGLIYIGATMSGLELPEMTRVALLLYACEDLLGFFGKIALAIAIALACLTTAIGLTTSVGNFFERITNGKFKYKTIVIMSTIFSAFFAVVGVEKIVAISAPVLTFLYPIAMVLIFLNIMPMEFKPSVYKGATFGAIIYAILDFVENYIVELKFNALMENVFSKKFMPFLWIIFALVFGIIFYLADRKK